MRTPGLAIGAAIVEAGTRSLAVRARRVLRALARAERAMGGPLRPLAGAAPTIACAALLLAHPAWPVGPNDTSPAPIGHRHPATLRHALASSGQGIVEYGLILAGIAAVAIIALVFFGDQVAAVVDAIGEAVDRATS